MKTEEEEIQQEVEWKRIQIQREKMKEENTGDEIEEDTRIF